MLYVTSVKKASLNRENSESWQNMTLQFSADLVTFTEEILNGKLHFLRSVNGTDI